MKKTKRRNNIRKIALFLVMVLTMTQIATVPVAAEEFTGNTVLEQDVFQDGSDTDAIMESIEDVDVMMESSKDAAVEIVQEPELFQDSEEEAAVELFSAGDTAEFMPELTSGEPAAEKNIQYHVYHEWINSTGDGVMLPNSQMIISTILFDCTNDDNWTKIQGYTIEIQPLAEGYVGKFEVSVDDHNIIINSHNETGWFDFQADFLLNEKVIHTFRFTFNVNEYKLTPQTLVDENGNKLNPEVGESIDLSKVGFELQEYRNGKLYPVEDPSKFKIGIEEGAWENGEKWYDYDVEGWALENVSGQDLPIMTRTTENSTWFALTVKKQVTEDDWELIARIHFPFESLSNYEGGGEEGDIWHDNSSEELSDYELWVDYEDTIGNGAMLPDSQMTIVTELVDKTNNYSNITDYKLEIVTQSKFGDATVAANGKKLVIESNDKIGAGNCYVSVQIPDGNGSYEEVFRKDIYFSVSRYMLTPEMFVDKNGKKINPKVGESIDLSKVGIELKEYRDDGTLVAIGDPETLKVTVWYEESEEMCDYDVNGWKLQEVSGQDLPIMTRTSHNNTWIAVVALKKMEDNSWNQIARRIYYFDEVKKHTHSWKKGKVTKEATCTSDGIRKDICSCGETKNVKISAKGHTTVKDAAVAATALAEGKTEGSHCSVCGKVLKKQKTVAKLTPTISLTVSSLKLKTNQSTTAFRAKGFAKGDYVKKVTAGNTGIVKVTNAKKDGRISLTAGKKTGTTTVTVTLASGKKASCKVTVQKSTVKTTKITASIKNLTLKKGETYSKLASSVVVTPVTSQEKIKYTSSDTKVATVSSKGVIEAKKPGTAKITIKSGSKMVVVTVKVTGIKTTKLSGVPTSKKISKGKSFTINAVASPKNTDEKITYKSSNTKVATVTEKGVVKGVSKGTATITVQSGSKKLTCKVTVK